MNHQVRRRELLLALLAGPLAFSRAGAAAEAQGAEIELVVCGGDEVFILAIGESASPASRKVWSWRAADSPEIPPDLQSAFRSTDDCKPLDGGRRILISSSSGAIALIDRATRRASFHARVTNAHSIEMLPGSRVAAAASTSTAPTGNRIVIFDATRSQEIASDALRSAHGVVWDESRHTLWALGGDVIRGYAIGPAGGPVRLERTFEMALPDSGGHDLVAVPGSARLFVSTERGVWYFDRDERRIIPHDSLAGQVNVKSYSVHPRTGRIVYVQAEAPEWWAEHLHFQRPDGALRLPGEHLYKARWI